MSVKQKNYITLCDPELLGLCVAKKCAALFKTADEPFYIGLSGGNTPKQIFTALCATSDVNWNKLRIYFTDERYVPSDRLDSNYGMTQQFLLQHVPIPETYIFPIPTSDSNPKNAAYHYHRTIDTTIPKINDIPQFDLLLLGIGADGHIASLFPETPILSTAHQWAEAVFVPILNTWRISLTFSIINNAKHLIFFAAGTSKAEIIQHVFNKPDYATQLPIDQLRPKGTVEWFLDREAARLLV